MQMYTYIYRCVYTYIVPMCTLYMCSYQSFKNIVILNNKNKSYRAIFYNVPIIFCIFHNVLQSYKLLSKQHTFSYILTLITYHIETHVISELNKLKYILK